MLLKYRVFLPIFSVCKLTSSRQMASQNFLHIYMYNWYISVVCVTAKKYIILGFRSMLNHFRNTLMIQILQTSPQKYCTIFSVSRYAFFVIYGLLLVEHIALWDSLSQLHVQQIHLVVDCKYGIILNHLFQSCKVVSIAATSTRERFTHRIIFLSRILKLISRRKIFLS